MGLVSLKNNVTFGIHNLCEICPVDCVAPLVEEVLDSVLADMSESSLKETLFEVLVLSPVFKAVKSTL